MDSNAKISILKHFCARCEAIFSSDTDGKLVESHKNKDLCRFYAIISHILFRFGYIEKPKLLTIIHLLAIRGAFLPKID